MSFFKGLLSSSTLANGPFFSDSLFVNLSTVENWPGYCCCAGGWLPGAALSHTPDLYPAHANGALPLLRYNPTCLQTWPAECLLEDKIALWRTSCQVLDGPRALNTETGLRV